jgi:RNA polymerase primary sigma factor
MAIRQLTITKSITNRDSLSLEKYLSEIGKIEMISSDEEVVLARRIRLGDEKALETLTRANLRFVVSVAKQYQFQGLQLSDLVSEGNIGLIKAAQRFDETRGFKFISFAVWWIRQAIVQAISDQARLVRLPSNKIGLNKKIQNISTLLEQSLERLPSAEEIAEVLSIDVAEIRMISSFERIHQSLDVPLNEEMGGSRLDCLEIESVERTDSKVMYTQSLNQEMLRCLDSLPLRERNVLCFLYGVGGTNPLTLEQIGARLHLTRERVRQIKSKAIKLLRSPQRSKLLKGFL